MTQLKNTIERTMFYGAKPIIFERVKALSENPTKAEIALWSILRKKQMMGLRFKHQQFVFLLLIFIVIP
jgi:very-short-patch-repair endonuclease